MSRNQKSLLKKEQEHACPCGAATCWSISLVEYDKNGFLTPRTMTAHLCKGCGAVAFDMLAQAGFLSGDAPFFPGPPEIAAHRIPPLPPVKCGNCGRPHKTGDCDQPPDGVQWDEMHQLWRSK